MMRPGVPRGASNQAVPPIIIPTPIQSSMGRLLAATGQLANPAHGVHRTDSVVAAAPNNGAAKAGKSAPSSVPARINGSNSTLNTGTRIKLAAGATHDRRPKASSNNGANPSVTSHWARTRALRPRQRPSRPPNPAYRQPTAPNDSQVPGARAARGSRVNTKASVVRRSLAPDRSRRHQSAATKAAIISSARWTGTENPARRP